jgi:hypothetical protein
MLKVRQNDEIYCATFCEKPVESVETVEKMPTAKPPNFQKLLRNP